jgi:hypothetical protein
VARIVGRTQVHASEDPVSGHHSQRQLCRRLAKALPEESSLLQRCAMALLTTLLETDPRCPSTLHGSQIVPLLLGPFFFEHSMVEDSQQARAGSLWGALEDAATLPGACSVALPEASDGARSGGGAMNAEPAERAPTHTSVELARVDASGLAVRLSPPHEPPQIQTGFAPAAAAARADGDSAGGAGGGAASTGTPGRRGLWPEARSQLSDAFARAPGVAPRMHVLCCT